MRTGAAGQYVGVVLAVVVALLCSGSRPASATHDVEGRRLTGENRFETAAAIARREPGRAEHALLARADDFPDALAAAALAGRLGAPILLTGRDELPEPTTDALVALGVEAVTLLGGPAAIGPEVVLVRAGDEFGGADGLTGGEEGGRGWPRASDRRRRGPWRTRPTRSWSPVRSPPVTSCSCAAASVRCCKAERATSTATWRPCVNRMSQRSRPSRGCSSPRAASGEGSGCASHPPSCGS